MGSCCLQWSSWIVCCLIIILFNVLPLRHWGGSSIHWVQQIPESLCIRCENIKRVICFVTYATRRGAWRRHRWRWKHKPMDKLVLLASLTAAADGGQMAGVVPNPSRLDQRAMIKFCRGWRMSTSKHSPSNVGSVRWTLPVEDNSEGLHSTVSGRTTVIEWSSAARSGTCCCERGLQFRSIVTWLSFVWDL